MSGATDAARSQLRARLDARAALPLDDPRIAIGMDQRRRRGRAQQLRGDRIAIFGRAIIEHDLGAQARASLPASSRGALLGMTIVAAMPSRFAAQATPCA